MNLYNELNKIKGLRKGVKLMIECKDGEVIKGEYSGYTKALDNEPEISQVDILSFEGIMYGLLETEIASIKKI